MPSLKFGQPFPGVFQVAYVVEDIHKSIKEWTSKLLVGPWFLTESFIGECPIYRGQRVDADVAIAHSFAGHMNVELIQPNDGLPSVYKEVIEARGYGFHHWGIATTNIEADIGRYEGLGMNLAFQVAIPNSNGARVAFLDPGSVLPGFVELIQMTPDIEGGLSRVYGAALCWDGSTQIDKL